MSASLHLSHFTYLSLSATGGLWRARLGKPACRSVQSYTYSRIRYMQRLTCVGILEYFREKNSSKSYYTGYRLLIKSLIQGLKLKRVPFLR